MYLCLRPHDSEQGLLVIAGKEITQYGSNWLVKNYEMSYHKYMEPVDL